MDAIDRAADFIHREARLLDRRRFEHHVGGEPAGGVVGALGAYANPDGGFGHALESDLRTSASQPVAVNVALSILIELGADAADLVRGCCHFLDLVSAPDGKVPIILPSALSDPHASHWSDLDWPLDSPNPTAGIVGRLHALGAGHRWLDRATTWCWERLQHPIGDAHEVREGLTFLEHVPDRERAQRLLPKLRADLEGAALYRVEPDDDSYGLSPLMFAPRPDCLARSWFDDELLERHLTATSRAQQDDGGWPITWEPPSAAAESEWRGSETVRALLVLRDWDRL